MMQRMPWVGLTPGQDKHHGHVQCKPDLDSPHGGPLSGGCNSCQTLTSLPILVDVVLVVAILKGVKWNLKTDLFFVVVVVVCMSILPTYPQRPEEGVQFPGTIVTDNCEPPLSALNWSQVFWKSSPQHKFVFFWKPKILNAFSNIYGPFDDFILQCSIFVVLHIFYILISYLMYTW